jgi:hypothetical protein
MYYFTDSITSVFYFEPLDFIYSVAVYVCKDVYTRNFFYWGRWNVIWTETIFYEARLPARRLFLQLGLEKWRQAILTEIKVYSSLKNLELLFVTVHNNLILFLPFRLKAAALIYDVAFYVGYRKDFNRLLEDFTVFI